MDFGRILRTGFGYGTNPLSTTANLIGDVLNPNVDVIPGVSAPRSIPGMTQYYPNGVPTAVNQKAAPKRTTAGEQLSGAYADSGGGGGSTSGGGGSTAPTYDPGDLAYLDDQLGRLNRQFDSTGGYLNNGLTQLGDDYNKQVSGANSNQSRAMEDFNTKEFDTTRAKDTAINRTNTNARSLAEGLRRRIGLASGSNSSAYQITAPGAVAREATKNRTGIVENFGANFRDLDTTRNRVKTDFESLLQDLEAQRKSKESDFRSGILSKQSEIDNSRAEVARQKALLLGGGYTQAKAAMAPYSNAIDSRQTELDGLYNRFRTPFSVKAVDVKAPNLRDYTVDRSVISANQQMGSDPNSPYAQFLRKNQEEDEQLV